LRHLPARPEKPFSRPADTEQYATLNDERAAVDGGYQKAVGVLLQLFEWWRRRIPGWQKPVQLLQQIEVGSHGGVIHGRDKPLKHSGRKEIPCWHLNDDRDLNHVGVTNQI